MSKVIVITGASSGIGQATAELLARQGNKMVLGARRESRLQEIVKKLRTLTVKRLTQSQMSLI